MKFTPKKNEILDVSRRMFLERGYRETSLRDIAAVLDLKAASLYSHFKSKEEILEAICLKARTSLSAAMEEVLAQEDAETRFMLYIRRHIENLLDDTESFQIYRKYWKLVDEAQNGDYYSFNLTYLGFIVSLFRDMFPNEEELECYIPNASPLFFLETLNSIPKYLNPDCTDREMIIEDFQYRIVYGFKQDVKTNKPSL